MPFAPTAVTVGAPPPGGEAVACEPGERAPRRTPSGPGYNAWTRATITEVSAIGPITATDATVAVRPGRKRSRMCEAAHRTGPEPGSTNSPSVNAPAAKDSAWPTL